MMSGGDAVTHVETRNEAAIRDRLVERGRALFDARKEPIRFTDDDNANTLLNDIVGCPHAFVLGCMMHVREKAERAWLVPYRISQRFGGFTIEMLRQLSLPDMKRLMKEPDRIHRMPDRMAQRLHSGVQHIVARYAGDASRIWIDRPSSAEVVYRFREFYGVGPKIASMAANIIAGLFKIELTDHYSIDISADVHVLRVFGRFGLSEPDATTEQIVYKARALHPQFPGLIDLPCWEIGRTWCKPTSPICNECYMSDLCAFATSGANSRRS
jgi:endonuclease III